MKYSKAAIPIIACFGIKFCFLHRAWHRQ